MNEDAIGIDPRELLEEDQLMLVGRWAPYPGEDGIVTVNSGSRLVLAWRGAGPLTLDFGPNLRPHAAHVYVRQSGTTTALWELGEQPVSVRLSRAPASSRAVEEVHLVVKDVDEYLNRWEPPFDAAVWLRRVHVPPSAHLVPPAQLTGPPLEFLGDSLTQGVRVANWSLGPQGSDGSASFAHLVAQAFDAPARQVGFGGQGLLVPGNGRVPPAPETVAWNFAGSPVDCNFAPEVVVIAFGTNDGASGQPFACAYRDYLSRVRTQFPDAHLLGVAPAARNHDEWLRAAVEGFGDRRVSLAFPREWLEPADYTDGVHPNRRGHRKLARGLVSHISSLTRRELPRW